MEETNVEVKQGMNVLVIRNIRQKEEITFEIILFD